VSRTAVEKSDVIEIPADAAAFEAWQRNGQQQAKSGNGLASNTADCCVEGADRSGDERTAKAAELAVLTDRPSGEGRARPSGKRGTRATCRWCGKPIRKRSDGKYWAAVDPSDGSPWYCAECAKEKRLHEPE
jgi:hypothetical protein